MLTFYPGIKLVHVAAIMASGSFFALRALALLGGMRWPRQAPVRYLGYTIDTVLLTAALMLLTILPRELFANGWLWTKLGLVAAYVYWASPRSGRSAAPWRAPGWWRRRGCASCRLTSSPARTIRWAPSGCSAPEPDGGSSWK